MTAAALVDSGYPPIERTEARWAPAPADSAAPRAGRALDVLRRLAARQRARRRAARELAGLGAGTRADVGLPPAAPRVYDELRFVAIPDRLDAFGPVGRR